MKEYSGVKYSSIILKLGTKRNILSSSSGRFTPWKEIRSLGEPQNLNGRNDGEKYRLSLPRIEPKLSGSLRRNLVTILTELLRLPFIYV
jgi:hypothetical protein